MSSRLCRTWNLILSPDYVVRAMSCVKLLIFESRLCRAFESMLLSSRLWYGILVGTIYTPPGINGYPYYGPILEELVSSYPCQIILGDFNTDLLKNTVASREFVDQLESLSLTVVNKEEPTHFSVTLPTK
jgi:hypothetical protein